MEQAIRLLSSLTKLMSCNGENAELDLIDREIAGVVDETVKSYAKCGNDKNELGERISKINSILIKSFLHLDKNEIHLKAILDISQDMVELVSSQLNSCGNGPWVLDLMKYLMGAIKISLEGKQDFHQYLFEIYRNVSDMLPEAFTVFSPENLLRLNGLISRAKVEIDNPEILEVLRKCNSLIMDLATATFPDKNGTTTGSLVHVARLLKLQKKVSEWGVNGSAEDFNGLLRACFETMSNVAVTYRGDRRTYLILDAMKMLSKAAWAGTHSEGNKIMKIEFLLSELAISLLTGEFTSMEENPIPVTAELSVPGANNADVIDGSLPTKVKSEQAVVDSSLEKYEDRNTNPLSLKKDVQEEEVVKSSLVTKAELKENAPLRQEDQEALRQCLVPQRPTVEQSIEDEEDSLKKYQGNPTEAIQEGALEESTITLEELNIQLHETEFTEQREDAVDDPSMKHAGSQAEAIEYASMKQIESADKYPQTVDDLAVNDGVKETDFQNAEELLLKKGDPNAELAHGHRHVESYVKVEKPAEPSVLIQTGLVEESPVNPTELVEQSTVKPVDMVEQSTVKPVELVEQSTVKTVEMVEQSTVKPVEMVEQSTVKPVKMVEQSTVKPVELVEQSTVKPLKLVEQSSVKTLELVEQPPVERPELENCIGLVEESQVKDSEPVDESLVKDAETVEEHPVKGAEPVQEPSVKDVEPVEDIPVKDAELVEKSLLKDAEVAEAPVKDAESIKEPPMQILEPAEESLLKVAVVVEEVPVKDLESVAEQPVKDLEPAEESLLEDLEVTEEPPLKDAVSLAEQPVKDLKPAEESLLEDVEVTEKAPLKYAESAKEPPMQILEPVEESLLKVAEVVEEVPVKDLESVAEQPVKDLEPAEESLLEDLEVTEEPPLKDAESLAEQPVKDLKPAEESLLEDLEVTEEAPLKYAESAKEPPVQVLEPAEESLLKVAEVVEEVPVKDPESVAEQPVKDLEVAEEAPPLKDAVSVEEPPVPTSHTLVEPLKNYEERCITGNAIDGAGLTLPVNFETVAHKSGADRCEPAVSHCRLRPRQTTRIASRHLTLIPTQHIEPKEETDISSVQSGDVDEKHALEDVSKQGPEVVRLGSNFQGEPNIDDAGKLSPEELLAGESSRVKVQNENDAHIEPTGQSVLDLRAEVSKPVTTELEVAVPENVAHEVCTDRKIDSLSAPKQEQLLTEATQSAPVMATIRTGSNLFKAIARIAANTVEDVVKTSESPTTTSTQEAKSVTEPNVLTDKERKPKKHHRNEKWEKSDSRDSKFQRDRKNSLEKPNRNHQGSQSSSRGFSVPRANERRNEGTRTHHRRGSNDHVKNGRRNEETKENYSADSALQRDQ